MDHKMVVDDAAKTPPAAQYRRCRATSSPSTTQSSEMP